MVAIAEDVVVKLTAEISGFNKGMEKSSAALGRFESSVNKSMANVRRALAAVGVAVVAREYIQLADASANLAARIRLVAGSAENAARVQKQLLDIANRTRVDFEGVVTLYARLGRSADDLGISQERLLGFTETFSQALKISGASSAEAGATVLQLSQALASGYLRGAELNSVLEQGGRAATALADGLGVPIGQLKKLGEEGQLTSARVIAAIESQGAKIRDEFSRMPVTVGDALTVMQNKLLDFVGRVDKSSEASKGMAKAVLDLGKILDDPDFAAGITAALQGLAGVFTVLAAAVAGAYRAMRDLGNLANELTGREWVNPALTSEQRNARAKHGKKSGFVLPGVDFPKPDGSSAPGTIGDSGAKRMSDAERAAQRYAEAISDLDFKIEQLARTEQEAAFQEQLRNALSAAGVTLATAEGQAIAEKVAQIQELTAAGEAQAAAWAVEAANANRVLDEMHQKMAEAAEEWRQIGETIENSVADAFVEMASNMENAREIIADLIADIGRLIAKALILKAIEMGVDAIFGGSGGSSGGKALGGLANAGNAYMVGEAGPELFVPRVTGSIVPNNRIGGSPFVVQSNFSVAPGVNKAELLSALQAYDARLRRDIVPIVVNARRGGGMRDFN